MKMRNLGIGVVAALLLCAVFAGSAEAQSVRIYNPSGQTIYYKMDFASNYTSIANGDTKYYYSPPHHIGYYNGTGVWRQRWLREGSYHFEYDMYKRLRLLRNY